MIRRPMPERAAEIQRRLDRHETQAEIARHLGISRQAVFQHVRKRSLAVRVRYASRLRVQR